MSLRHILIGAVALACSAPVSGRPRRFQLRRQRPGRGGRRHADRQPGGGHGRRRLGRGPRAASTTPAPRCRAACRAACRMARRTRTRASGSSSMPIRTTSSASSTWPTMARFPAELAGRGGRRCADDGCLALPGSGGFSGDSRNQIPMPSQAQYRYEITALTSKDVPSATTRMGCRCQARRRWSWRVCWAWVGPGAGPSPSCLEAAVAQQKRPASEEAGRAGVAPFSAWAAWRGPLLWRGAPPSRLGWPEPERGACWPCGLGAVLAPPTPVWPAGLAPPGRSGRVVAATVARTATAVATAATAATTRPPRPLAPAGGLGLRPRLPLGFSTVRPSTMGSARSFGSRLEAGHGLARDLALDQALDVLQEAVLVDADQRDASPVAPARPVRPMRCT